MENIAAKCAARYSLIPPVTGASSESSAHDHSQIGDLEDANKINGLLLLPYVMCF